MTEKPAEKTPRGLLRAVYGWLGGSATAQTPPAAPDALTAVRLPSRIAHYAVVRKLGEGGMGVVYEARDERLERVVALKMMSGVVGTMSSGADEETGRRRFWREARLAASVNHPNVCQIYEIGDEGGQLFIAMELLEGEALSERLKQGPLPVSEAVPVALGILSALSALHVRGVVHRDLKPSNVFLTPHGVKLLDFGLARPELPPSRGADVDLTLTGVVMGTPRYMAPEQVRGEAVDAKSDLFAAGALLFEMLAGRPAFTGRTIVEVLHETLHGQPPALTGSAAVAAVDRVIRRALAKARHERPASADAMADELRAVQGLDSDGAPALAHPLTRLVVLPFRVLRADAETDFLAFSLPDAISTSLSGIGSLVVRSSATAARFMGDAPDLKAIAAEANVDRVVMGTLLRVGGQLRATAQLVDAPAGTLLTAHTVQTSLGDVFTLQDDLTRRIVDALALPLGGPVATPTPDTPHDEQAYQLYLQANELARAYETMTQARDLYRRCLELDPRFAPAWAHLGRCHRVIGKFVEGTTDSEDRAEAAFQRALELNPRLSVAHKFYAHLEADIGQPVRALRRLLEQARRHGNDPELFAGIVHACRYCGLFEASLSAHREARRLDPNVPTSYEQTLLMMGRLDQLLGVDPPASDPSRDAGAQAIVLGLAGRRDEARDALLALREKPALRVYQLWIDYLIAWIDRRPTEMQARLDAFKGLKIQGDPEALFEIGRLFCDAGDPERGLAQVRRSVSKGYYAVQTLDADVTFRDVRSRPEFQAITATAEAGRARALAAFREAGGERLLGAPQ